MFTWAAKPESFWAGEGEGKSHDKNNTFKVVYMPADTAGYYAAVSYRNRSGSFLLGSFLSKIVFVYQHKATLVSLDY